MPDIKHTGILLGSFNPVHLGHTRLIHRALASKQISELWIIIHTTNKFKKTFDVVSADHRLNMLKLAIKNLDSKYIITESSTSIGALDSLCVRYPNKTFSIIMNETIHKSLHQWEDYLELTSRFSILVFPDYKMNDKLVNSYDIRQKLHDKEKIDQFVHNDVLNYIKINDLYA